MSNRSEEDALVAAFDRLRRDHPQQVLIAAPRSSATVEQVDDLARGIAARLVAIDCPAGAVVGLQAPNGPGFLGAILALRRAGLAALLLDRSAPEHGVARALDRCGASGSIRCSSAWPADASAFRISATVKPAVDRRMAHGAVIKLTSASTGDARGILTPTDALLADDAALSRSMGLRPADRIVAVVPFSHSYGLSSLVVPALARGIRLVLPDRTGPFTQLEAARDLSATVFPTVPAFLAGLLDVHAPPALPASLRLVISAGAPLLPETARRFRTRFGRPVHAFYGASECGGISYDRDGTAAEAGSVGTPVEGVRVELIEQAATGGEAAGRVVVVSPAVAQGYVPQADPRLAGGRFVTDDLGTWVDGRLCLVGRLRGLINVKGHKVNPTEVERVIAELEHVDQVRVIGISRGSAGDECVRAVVACRSGSLTPARVVEWCRGRLNDFEIPRSVVLVDRMPTDARGKIEHALLAAVDDTGGSLG